MALSMRLSVSAYETVFDEAPDGLLLIDPDTERIRECNRRVCELVDREREALLDSDVTALIDEVRGPETEPVPALDRDDIATRTWLLRTGPNTVVPFDVRVSPISIDGDNHVLARLTAAADETDRSQDPDLDRELKTRAVDAAPIGITITDPDQADNPMIYVNEMFEEITGYSAAEAVGRNCRFLQGPETRAEPVDEMREAIAAERPATVELKNYRSDGTEFWNRVTIAPVRDDEGTVTNYVGFQEDITERKRSRQALELADHLLKTVPSGVFRTEPTPDGTFEYANPALVSLLGVDSAEQLQEYRVADFYANPDARAELVETLRDTDAASVKREVTLEPLDGESIDVVITASLSTDESGAEHVHKAVQDITERKRYEKRLKEQRDDLDVLNQMLRHDIRNDLQLVTASADFLHDHIDDAGREYLATIRESAGHAVELTQTARDMSDVMLSTDENLTRVDLRSTLESELERVRSEHAAAAITVEGTIPRTTVVADDMLHSVFRNLLTNAIQHNDREVPTVTVAATERDESVVVRVADDGPGVPDEQKDEIFGKGTKGGDSAGTGLGLYLVATLVDTYGGSVSVEDNEPRGAVFVVELPTGE